MGREAVCVCDWAAARAEVKALLETGELILRGGMRRRVAFAELREVAARGDQLRFRVGEEDVALSLGASVAAKWAEVLTSPPPSLARKLGITGQTIVRTIGGIEDNELQAAIGEALRVPVKDADLIVAVVDTPEGLREALDKSWRELARAVPIWMVYRKGPGHAVNEAAIRSLLRSRGLMDTKVASVSKELTALKFVMRKDA